MSLFVDKSKLIEIKFYEMTDPEGNEKVSLSKEENPGATEYSMFFRRPSYVDNVKILDSALKIVNDGEVQVNPILVRYQRFCTLLVKWTLKNEEGKDMEVNKENINQLDPEIANLIVAELEKTIQ